MHASKIKIFMKKWNLLLPVFSTQYENHTALHLQGSLAQL
jgi:hypothetical protein